MMLTSKQFTDCIRQLMETPVWFDDGAFKLYLYCLAKASPNCYEWKGYTLQPGDLPISERNLAAVLYWSRNKLRRKMDILKSLGMITIESVPMVATIIHIVDWPYAQAISAPQVASQRCTKQATWPQTDATGGPVLYARASDYMPETEPFQSDYENQVEPERFQNPEIWQHSGSIAGHDSYIRREHIYDMYGTKAEPQGFSEIWLAYPAHRRAHRREAVELVAKALEEGATIDIIRTTLEADKLTPDWQTNNGQYIPGIVKWLQRESWKKSVPSEGTGEDEMWVSE